MSMLKEGTIASPMRRDFVPAAFASLRVANHSSVYSAASFWWTVGGGEYQPLAFCCRRMPDPFLFTNMLTGRLDSATASN
jgi:type VI secretion system protein ImpM